MSRHNSRSPDEKWAQTSHGETGNVSPTPRRIDLSSLRDVRLELAAVYRKMATGEIESHDGTRRAYVLKTIHDVIVSAELERRISQLEGRPAVSFRHTAPALPNLSNRERT